MGDGNKKDEAENTLRRWANGAVIPDDLVQEVVGKFIASGRSYVDSFLVAIVHHRMHGLCKLINKLPAVWEAMFKKAMDGQADIEDLMSLLREMHTIEEDYTNFLLKVGTGRIMAADIAAEAKKEAQPSPFEDFNRLSPQSRQTIIQALKELQQMAEERAAKAKTEKKPEDKNE